MRRLRIGVAPSARPIRARIIDFVILRFSSPGAACPTPAHASAWGMPDFGANDPWRAPGTGGFGGAPSSGAMQAYRSAVAQLSVEDVIPLHLADVTFPEWHPLHGQAGAVLAFALRHASGLILYETGIGRGNRRIDDYYQVVHRPLEAELEANGHQLGDVRLVVNSHLHFDHCGNNMLFSGVPIFVQATEYEAARQPDYTIPEWVDFAGVEYAVVDGDVQVAEGVRIVSTPGHTAGHQSVVVDTNDGIVALAGQAIYCEAEYRHIQTTGTTNDDDPPPDPAQYLASAMRLVELGPRRVHFSHDPAVWNAEP